MPTRRRRARRRARPKARGLGRDPRALYEAAVQSVDFDLDFIERVYRYWRGRRFERFREDFCATAALAAGWVLRRPSHRAWAVDLDPAPLAWCRRHRLPVMRRAASRLTLLERDVRRVSAPRVDAIAALNFSYWVFKTRGELLDYFRTARRALGRDGILVVNAFGGNEAMADLTEKRVIAASQAVDGTPVERFTYEWEHESFNVVDHHIVCHIHFRFRDGTRMRRAFSYDWRLWTLPEVKEAMLEAGFRRAEIYLEGWNEKKNEGNEIFRLRRTFENQLGWLAYVVGLR
jgi:hypothetical protein